MKLPITAWAARSQSRSARTSPRSWPRTSEAAIWSRRGSEHALAELRQQLGVLRLLHEKRPRQADREAPARELEVLDEIAAGASRVDRRHACALVGDDGGNELRLVAVAAVDRGLAHLRRLGDARDRHARVAVLQQELPRGVEDRGVDALIERAPARAPGGRVLFGLSARWPSRQVSQTARGAAEARGARSRFRLPRAGAPCAVPAAQTSFRVRYVALRYSSVTDLLWARKET